MGARENKVEKYLNGRVVELGGRTWKWVSPGKDGVTDRIVIIKGETHYVEVKTVDGKLTSVQEREHARIREVGGKVHTAYGQEGVDKLLEEINV